MLGGAPRILPMYVAVFMEKGGMGSDRITQTGQVWSCAMKDVSIAATVVEPIV